MLADPFKLAHHSLLKLKKSEGLVYNEELELAEINQIVETPKDISRGNNFKPPDKSILNKTHINHTYLGTCIVNLVI